MVKRRKIIEHKDARKDAIIKTALLEMGFPFCDADNKEAEEVKAASFLFDRALMELLRDGAFTENVKEELPVLTDRGEHLGKREYIKPSNCITVITPGVEEIGDKLYTTKNNFILRYKVKMDIKDISDKYDTYLAFTLAILLAPVVGKVKALSRLITLRDYEKQGIMPLASYDINLGDLN